MDWSFLSFLAEPWFVLPWYAVGILGAGWMLYDAKRVNAQVKPVMKWAWPIIVLFLSVFGLAVYRFSSRPPGIGGKQGGEAREAYDAYVTKMPRRVMGSVIHCVAGDGLGIITAMVVARLLRLSFWQEFWFEYAVGFGFGWFIFQYKSMRMMTDSPGKALWMGGRAEFFSMLTVMAGMGAVMAYVTAKVVGQQPQPDTYAFWGFAMLGLLVGFIATYPMNWALVAIGWKHGLGHHEPQQGGQRREGSGARTEWTVTGMAVAGLAALAVPGVLYEAREGQPTRASGAVLPEGSGGGPRLPLQQLAGGLEDALGASEEALAAGRRAEATHALDAAMRVAQVGRHAARGGPFTAALDGVRRARKALQDGRPEAAARTMEDTHAGLAAASASLGDAAAPEGLGRYRGGTLINARGVRIGEVVGFSGDEAELALGGRRDFWGFIDLGGSRRARVPADLLVFGADSALGPTLVAAPTFELPRL